MAQHGTAPRSKAPSALVEALRAGGIVAPRMTIAEAKRAGLPLELACALLEKESSGGHNVYGHDPSIFRGRGKVTRSNYAEYKRQRIASRNRSMQGVGPCQLTWWELQDTADAQGGCWRPEINMRTGFRHLATLVERYGTSDGARRYNGSGSAAQEYSRDLIVKARRWEAIVDAARAEPAMPKRAAEPAKRRNGNGRPAAPAGRNGNGRIDAPAGRNGSGDRGAAAPTLAALAAELRRRDEQAEQAWRRLVAHGHRRRRRLLAEKQALAAGTGDRRLRELLEALARIEDRLGTLVEVSTHKPVMPTSSPVGAIASSAVAAKPAGKGPAAPAPERPLDGYKLPELVREVEAAEQRKRQLQGELIARYEMADRQLAALLGDTGDRDRPASNGHGGGRDGRDRRTRAARERPRRAQAPRAPRAGRTERDPLGGRSAITRLGDRGLFVRRSKIALARYLAKRGTPEHAALRRRLRREAGLARRGDVASPAWARAVEAAQHLAGRPVTGELDGELTKLLLPHWPRDPAAKRALRSTPAWRTIPGQLTPNFNIKELACEDREHTPYVAGLMREQGLSKKQALARAKGLAKRLERVRRLGGDRPLVVTSAYRTRAYNATLDGSATNSSHTRGFAADTPPPPGVSLEQHRQHVLQAFECGVGYYPMGRGYFVHGDFDRTLGGRRLW